MGVIAALVISMAATVASVVTVVITTIAAVVGAIAATLVSVISTVVASIGSVVGESIAAVKTTLYNTTATIYNGVVDAIRLIQMEIEFHSLTTFKPVVDGLTVVKNFVLDVGSWTNTALTPVKGIIDIVNTVSAIVIIKKLLEGEAKLSDAIKAVYESAGESTAFAMLQMYNSIIDVSVTTTKMVHDNYNAIAEIVDTAENRLKEEQRQLTLMLTEKLEDTETDLREALQSRLTPVETTLYEVEMAMRSTPYFQMMLLRALD